jgi:predicted nucleic acid-binding protein
VKRGQIVLLDTNIIIEAVRTRCWQALTGYFQIETVEKCCEEARAGKARRVGYVKVEDRHLSERLGVHSVPDLALVELSVAFVDADRLDEGERHLWAHARGRSDEWIAATADRAAVNAALEFGWIDRLKSLEELSRAVGVRPSLKKHFTTQWLSTCRTEFALRGSK